MKQFELQLVNGTARDLTRGRHHIWRLALAEEPLRFVIGTSYLTCRAIGARRTGLVALSLYQP